MSQKYGVPLIPEHWRGWLLRAGHFTRTGKVEGLVAAADAVLVWSGGTSEVTLHARGPRGTERHRFVRRGGMVDLLPRGTVIEEVSWHGQPSSCLSVNLDEARLKTWLGRDAALQPEQLRLAVVDAHVVDLVRRLEAQALGGAPLGALYVEALSLTLASYVASRYGIQQSPPSEERALSPLPAEELIAFVDENLDGSIGLANLAALAGYSPDHFARLFKQTFGLTPYQYVLERRVERAKSLLRDNSHSIAEVALLCGFATQAHFHTIFKARTGVTPRVFRKN